MHPDTIAIKDQAYTKLNMLIVEILVAAIGIVRKSQFVKMILIPKENVLKLGMEIFCAP
jgi:hypothetical protein